VNVDARQASLKLLLVIDDSSASKRAIAYVARMLGRRKGVHLCVAHLLPPLPSRLLEFGGSEDPDEETRLDAGLKMRQARWLAEVKKTAQRALAAANTTLRNAGVPRSAIDVQFSDAIAGGGIANRLLEVARTSNCDTVVVGRESLSWFRELVQGDLAEELVRRGQGLTIWVVE
jgi:nucleotide-binding universal stress UspA family protein